MSDVTTSARSDSKNFRLPRNVTPSRYEMTLAPDLKRFKFSGEETIEVTVAEPTSKIVLNAADLKIQEASVSCEAGTSLTGKVSLDKDTELATITFAGVLGKGNWKLHIKFSGRLNDKLKGFYRSFWTDDRKVKHTIACTQFESTDARRAFPCFDEPEFKATYKVTLVVDANLTALSNARIVKETPLAGGPRNCFDPRQQRKQVAKKAVEFAETMKMSTYLVCFVVGELVSSAPVFVNGKELRVWCVPGKEHLTGFALRSAAFAVDWYEKRYGIPYPGGDKIDFIAIPDFAAGAMENLGCITFRETALLLDEKTATQGEFERVDEVVKHELAHMWFGDLVTMRWWNGLWLNESFATHESHDCMDAEYPHWRIWDGFALERAAASRVDALKSTHPIECPVNHPEEVAELFDVISYEKGCSVLHMIKCFIGREVFRAGVASYLARHSFGNTETHDLWDSLEQACRQAGLNIPVRTIMDAWVFTAGHPVVEVSACDADGFVTIKQRPFRFLPESTPDSVWPIPLAVKVKTASGVLEEKKFLFDAREQTVYIGKGFQWLVVNAGGTGFYRVRYQGSLMQKLMAGVQENLSVVERFNLVNDTWACVRAGLVSTSEYLEMVKRFAGESDPNVWSILSGSMRTLHSLVPVIERAVLKGIIRELAYPVYEKLGWAPSAGESVQTAQLRGSIIGLLGTIAEDAGVQSQAREKFASWKQDRSSVDSNVVPAVVSILAYTGDAAQYEEFRRLSKEAKTPQEVQRFLFALAGFRDTELLTRTIDSTLSDDVRSQDAPYLLASVMGNEAASKAAWDFMRENWEKMVASYPDNGVVRMVSAVTALDSPELEQEVKDFFASHKVKSGDMAVAQALEQLRINVSLRERESGKLAAHLAAYAQRGTTAPAKS